MRQTERRIENNLKKKSLIMSLLLAMLFGAIYLIWGFIKENRPIKHEDTHVPTVDELIMKPSWLSDEEKIKIEFSNKTKLTKRD